MKKEHVFTLIVCIGITLLIAISTTWVSNEQRKDDDNFCKSLGYNESTDFNNNYGDLFDKLIECDNKFIFEVDYGWVTECIKYDKWKQCQKDQRNFEILNYKNVN